MLPAFLTSLDDSVCDLSLFFLVFFIFFPLKFLSLSVFQHFLGKLDLPQQASQ